MKHKLKQNMKLVESYFKAKDTPPEKTGEKEISRILKVNLVDANTDQKLANPSLMLWAMLGLSAEHSYILTPLS